VKAACQRHRDDLKNQKRKGIYFDEDLANRAIDFARLLKHSAGEYAGKPFELVDFQKFITWCLFGWRRASDGMRRFRRAFVSMASGNGKSPFAAFILMLCVFFDAPVEPRAAGYVVSTKKSQARPVFEEIKAFHAQDANLRRMLVVLKDNINCPMTQSKIEILGSEGTVDDGLVPHCVVYDEIHRARDRHRGTLEMIQSKLGKRRQPLILTITTAGDDQSVLWIEQYELATKVVARGNSIEADDLFVYIAELDDDEEIFREEAWPKANPMLPHGVVKLDQLRADVALAKIDPREKKRVMRLRMNRLVTSAVKAITSEMWATGNLPLPELDGRECNAALDLGWKDDLAAAALAFPLDDVEIAGETKRRIALVCQAWIPEECARNLAEEPWCSWIRDGWLAVTQGSVTDVEHIYAWFEEQQQKYAIRSVALDPNNARAPGIHLETTLGIPSFWFGQTCGKYNEPTRELLDALHEGRIIHGGNPVLAWAALNLVLKTDHRGYMMPAKNKAKDKIDPAVASIMAISEVLFHEQESSQPTGRVYAV
jgi:phage terminase large subunit-like protein